MGLLQLNWFSDDCLVESLPLPTVRLPLQEASSGSVEQEFES